MKSSALLGAMTDSTWPHAAETRPYGLESPILREMMESMIALPCSVATHRMSSMLNGILKKIFYSLQATTTP